MFDFFGKFQFVNVEILNVLFLCMLSAGLCCVYFKRQLALLKEDCNQSVLLMEKQIKMMSSASVGMGERLIFLEKRLSDLSRVQDQLQHADLEFSFSQAAKLLEQGLSADAVAANSGLSVSEVSLMELMRSDSSSGLANLDSAVKKPSLFTAHA